MSNEDTEKPEKTPLEIARDLISQLKEMEHYSRSNAQRLSSIWMVLSDELKEVEYAERVNALLNQQGQFQDTIESLISDYETGCNRAEQK